MINKTKTNKNAVQKDVKKVAYCFELGKKVLASEIWQLVYGKGIQRQSLERLTFCCPNKSCKAKLIVRNCFHLYAPDMAQFRLYQGQSHKIGCPYIKKRVYTRKADVQTQTRTKDSAGLTTNWAMF